MNTTMLAALCAGLAVTLGLLEIGEIAGMFSARWKEK